jgi:spore germination cell wall hydrolase CwlJ-like protein
MSDDFSTEIAVRTIYGEARGEGAAGMDAVAFVLLNRLSDGRWGKTLAAVCLAAFQFSCWNTADPNRVAMAKLEDGDPALDQAREALSCAGSGVDPTLGATHYVTAAVLEQGAPAWVSGATRTVQIGNHVFFKDVR